MKRTHTKNVASPLGVAGGKDGRFYVANEFGDDVLVYSPAARKLLGRLQNGGNVPIDVAVFNGELAVANQHVMTFFASGATTPTRTLNAPNVLQGSGAAFDAAGNCYWSFSNNSGKQTIVEFTRCKGKAHELEVTPGSPFGLAFDGSGNLYYTSYSSQANGVYRCTGTSSCKLIYTQFIDPQYLNFAAGFKTLWINDPGDSSEGSAIYAVDVATGKVVEKITAGLTFFNPPSGVAVAPGAF